jgi:hypothetical protein
LFNIKIKDFIYQIAIMSFLFFAIYAECKITMLTPWNLFREYIGRWNIEGFAYIIWFVIIPVNMKALISINRDRLSGFVNNKDIIIYIIFYIYNSLFFINLILYFIGATDITIIDSYITYINFFLLLVQRILAAPLSLIVLLYIIKSFKNNNFQFKFLAFSSILITIQTIIYIYVILNYPGVFAI